VSQSIRDRKNGFLTDPQPGFVRIFIEKKYGGPEYGFFEHCRIHEGTKQIEKTIVAKSLRTIRTVSQGVGMPEGGRKCFGGGRNRLKCRWIRSDQEAREHPGNVRAGKKES
jgi:hypothetical protein